MDWKAFIKSKDVQKDQIVITILYKRDVETVEEIHRFDHIPTDVELGVIVHAKLTKLEDLANNNEKVILNTEIKPLDPNVLAAEEKKAEQERLEKEKAAKQKALKEEAEKKQAEQQAAAKKAEDERAAYLASLPKKCYIRTFIFPDDSKKEFHSICDKKDYTREDRPNNELGLLTGEYVRELLNKSKIKETKDTVHFIK